MPSNWEKAVQEKFGFSASHLSLSHSNWLIESWDSKIYPELANDSTLLSKLDKLHKDFASNIKRNEGPLSQEIVAGTNHIISKPTPNILTNVGMTEMAKRSTIQNSSINSHHAIGTGTTTETISDLTLEAEVGRKTIGATDVVNQTERYASSFNSTDIVSPPQNISEAGIFTELVGGILIMRITAIPVLLDAIEIITLLTNVTHQNGVVI